MEEYGIDATISLAEPWRVIHLTRQRAPLILFHDRDGVMALIPVRHHG